MGAGELRVEKVDFGDEARVARAEEEIETRVEAVELKVVGTTMGEVETEIVERIKVGE